MLTLLILKRRGQFDYFEIIVKYYVVRMIFLHENLMKFLTCLWKFCLIYGFWLFRMEIQDLKVEALALRGNVFVQ